MKKLFLLLLAVGVIAGCKKSDPTPTTTTPTESDHTPSSDGNPAFTINGIRDLDLSTVSTGSVSLPLDVTQASGRSSETVALSVFDLPAGVYADLQRPSATTPYSSFVTFHTDYSGAGGDYIVHIQGGGASGTLRYPLRITVPKYNGFETDSTIYRKSRVEVDTSTSNSGNHYIAMVNDNGGVRLVLSFANGVKIPSAAASYRIVPAAAKPDEMQIQLYDYGLIYTSDGVTERTGSFTYDSLGKFIFRCNDVELSDGFHKRHLTASFSQ